MADIDLGHHRVSLFKKNSPKFFGPDKIHPNGAAHHAIFKHLMQNIPELQVDHKSNL